MQMAITPKHERRTGVVSDLVAMGSELHDVDVVLENESRALAQQSAADVVVRASARWGLR